MMPAHWTQTSLPEFPELKVHVGNFQRIEDFQWWFDGKSRRELLLCFSYKNGHAYLVAGKYELHGHLYFKKIMARTFSRVFTLRPCLFLRFPDVTPQQLDAIERDIESRNGTREISCIELLRLVLEQGGGIRMRHFEPSMIYLQQFVDSFFRHGFIDDSSGKPVRVEYYLTERWPWRELLKFLGHLEERFYWLGHSGLWTARIARGPGALLARIRSTIDGWRQRRSHATITA